MAELEVIDVESDEDLPPAEECQRCCEQFVQFTGTDEALAQYYLQDCGWNVQAAMNMYFESNRPAEDAAVEIPLESPKRKKAKSDQSPPQSGLAAASTAEPPMAAPPTASSAGRAGGSMPSIELFTVLSWNIDGLDNRNFKSRMCGVISTIHEVKPDVIFMQEVIRESQSLLLNQLGSDYTIVDGNSSGNADYYVVMMMKKSSVKFEESRVKSFETSLMGRNLLMARVKYREIGIQLMTAHLESCGEHHKERRKQLKAAFDIMKESRASDTVIFGGDLNLRDVDVTGVGGLPAGVQDMFVCCGARKECRYTWDGSRNVNISTKNGMGRSAFTARCRFDRVYVKTSQPMVHLRPANFGLCGLRKVDGAQCFPSDHWAVLCHFQVY